MEIFCWYHSIGNVGMAATAAKEVDRSNIIPMLRRPRGIHYHEYFMLLGITEFTKAYLQVKDNTWPFISLVKLTQNTRLNDNEVLGLLKIANSGFLFSFGISLNVFNYMVKTE